MKQRRFYINIGNGQISVFRPISQAPIAEEKRLALLSMAPQLSYLIRVEEVEQEGPKLT